MKIREAITETAEKVRYMLKDDRYLVDLTKKGAKVSKLRPTRHTIKWRAKNH